MYKIRILNSGGFQGAENVCFPIEVLATRFRPGLLDLYDVPSEELAARGWDVDKGGPIDYFNFGAKIGECELITEEQSMEHIVEIYRDAVGDVVFVYQDMAYSFYAFDAPETEREDIARAIVNDRHYYCGGAVASYHKEGGLLHRMTITLEE